MRKAAGHAQATMTERYLRAAQVAFPGAAERAEERVLWAVLSGDPGYARLDPEHGRCGT
jgi:hypothetical protein